MEGPVHDKPSAVVLVSGGLDSAVTLAMAVQEGYCCYALSFDYGQRHRFELEAAGRICRDLGAAEHYVTALDLRTIGGSALTSGIAVPGAGTGPRHATDIPVTYVPARNTIFLSVALARAEVLHTGDIFIGVNAVDYSGYPDCRPEYIRAFENMANLATRMSVEGIRRIRIHAPLLYLSKAEIICKGAALGVDFSVTHSCYDPSPEGLACGRCDSCRLRRKGFSEAGMTDPTRYAGKEP